MRSTPIRWPQAAVGLWALMVVLTSQGAARAADDRLTAQNVAYLEASVVKGLYNSARQLYDLRLSLALDLLPESASIAPRSGKPYEFKFTNQSMVRPKPVQKPNEAHLGHTDPGSSVTPAAIDLSAWAATLRLPDDPPPTAGKTGLAAARLYKAVNFGDVRAVGEIAGAPMEGTWGQFQPLKAWRDFHRHWFAPLADNESDPYNSVGSSDVLAMAVEYYRVLRFVQSEGLRYSLKFKQNRPQGKWSERADLVNWTLRAAPFYVAIDNRIQPANDRNLATAGRWYCRFSLEGEADLSLRFNNIESASDQLQVSASLVGGGDRWVPSRIDFGQASVVLTKEQTDGLPADVQVPAPAGTLALLLNLTGFDPKISHTVAEHLFGGTAATRYITGTVFDFPTKRSGKVGSRQVYGVGQEVATGKDGGVAFGVAASDGTSIMPCAQFRASAFSVMVGPWITQQGSSFKVHPAIGVGFDLASLLGRDDSPKPLVITCTRADRSWGRSGVDLTKGYAVKVLQWAAGSLDKGEQGNVRLIQRTSVDGKPLTDRRQRATLTFPAGNKENEANRTAWIVPRGLYRLVAPPGQAVMVDTKPRPDLDWTRDDTSSATTISLVRAEPATPTGPPIEAVWPKLTQVTGTGLPEHWQTVGRSPAVCMAAPVDPKRTDSADLYLRVDGTEPAGVQTNALPAPKGVTITATVQVLGDVRTWFEAEYLDEEPEKVLRSMTTVCAGAKDWTTHTLRLVLPAAKPQQHVCLRFMAAGKGEVRFTELTVPKSKK